MRPKASPKKDYTTPALFCACIILVFTFLAVTLAFQKPPYPSVSYGATEAEVEDYAYSLLALDATSDTAEHYLEALDYYNTQIAASKDSEQRFNLRLDLATLLGKTGDPAAGLVVLDEISGSELPLDAKYYLYSTYAYLYQRQGDERMATDYLLRISDEDIYDYVAKLDAGEIVPGETEKTDEDSVESEPEAETETEDSEEATEESVE